MENTKLKPDQPTLVSVIIPAFNRERTIARAIKSVLAQDYPSIELIVVDDASKDKTMETAERVAGGRIKLIRHSKNLGGAAARNTGINASGGRYIAFLDSDDAWLAGKVSKQVMLLENRDGQYGLAYTGVRILDSNGGVLREVINHAASENIENILTTNYIGTTSCVMVKSEMIKKAGGFDPSMKSCQDWDVYIRMGQLCSFCCVPELLVDHYWEHRDRISANPDSVLNGHRAIEAKHFRGILSLSKTKRLMHLNEMSFIFFNHGDTVKGASLLWQAFITSGNPMFLLKGMKRTFSSMIVRKRITP